MPSPPPWQRLIWPKARTLDEALAIDDGHVFKVLENIPEKKHHCIQLAVKTMHLGIEEYKAGHTA